MSHPGKKQRARGVNLSEGLPWWAVAAGLFTFFGGVRRWGHIWYCEQEGTGESSADHLYGLFAGELTPDEGPPDEHGGFRLVSAESVAAVCPTCRAPVRRKAVPLTGEIVRLYPGRVTCYFYCEREGFHVDRHFDLAALSVPADADSFEVFGEADEHGGWQVRFARLETVDALTRRVPVALVTCPVCSAPVRRRVRT